MAAYEKSLDAKHLVEIRVEGFYGPSAPARTQFSPYSYATQVGTDFIRNHQALVLILHLFTFMWIPGKAYHSVLDSCSCVWQFVKDAGIFSKFGVSVKDTGYNSSF
ncbi:hypothetical protein V6N11_007233 [Hibiscus sabdariffa]|uniref:Uncharacterized protein n=1 Tax=Hibiscus sabdariffa TaxID=183260 RepID=A0ABR2RTE1_9ROSI